MLTEPDGAPPEVVLVSLSSDAPGKDDTVKLGPGDHPFIWKPTIVFYPDPRLIAVQVIEHEVNDARATFHDDCSEDLLETVRQGRLRSPYPSRRLKEYVRERI